jgi:hypothetical protein
MYCRRLNCSLRETRRTRQVAIAMAGQICEVPVTNSIHTNQPLPLAHSEKRSRVVLEATVVINCFKVKPIHGCQFLTMECRIAWQNPSLTLEILDDEQQIYKDIYCS